ncbi:MULTISPECIES: LysR family transcriptional regulator [Pseudomonas]|uniref:Putative LysR family regulatory protein n=1 Tax=Pseudomonas fluorescens (strain Pf0-1) TaxID=205922 RepID=Q3KCB3_PSEPF|nr:MULTISPECIES: LysR family transcriptional regulator [Pseudomonas]ABA74592.1 putative LysR family regulatory protein [Pseudomonas fluorescens Pf0-1]MBL0796482.1 LysR family transcriptional regulator [Pseudomonas sp. B7]MBY9026392.1 LysR family transcriptional regulator [Pseudomonas fluorescens]MBY9030237.1 LysR family transcriptional regulator [Pseudomonas fluorescens]MBY9038210.1 LysR family transcriptional regulator [Pseudomonas fluorescens]
METPLSNSGNPPVKTAHRAPLALSGLDFKLLKVFKAVVEAGGFSAAQNELNVGLAAISKQISDLEIRIGMRLCTRGREGFHLTEEGRLVYQASIDLFASVDNFRDRLSSAQNELIGDLGVGVIDNTISDDNSPLVAALRKINEHSPKVRFQLQSTQLDEVERGVVEGRLVAGIVPVYQKREEFDYYPLYEERSQAYCAVGHPLFEMPAEQMGGNVLQDYECINHRYAIHRDKLNFARYDSFSASATQVEAVALLIKTGRFVGFLPQHYAAALVAAGQFRAVCPELIHFDTPFNLILRHNTVRSPLVKAFAQALGVDLKATA